MSRPRKRTVNRGYQLSAEAVAFLSENSPPLYQLTPNAVAFMKDCKAQLGAIAEDENLPRYPDKP